MAGSVYAEQHGMGLWNSAVHKRLLKVIKNQFFFEIIMHKKCISPVNIHSQLRVNSLLLNTSQQVFTTMALWWSIPIGFFGTGFGTNIHFWCFNPKLKKWTKIAELHLACFLWLQWQHNWSNVEANRQSTFLFFEKRRKMT